MNETIKKEIISLVENAKNAFVSSIDAEGYPNVKAMFALKHDGVKTHYFSTNLSSRRTQQFKNNPKAWAFIYAMKMNLWGLC